MDSARELSTDFLWNFLLHCQLHGLLEINAGREVLQKELEKFAASHANTSSHETALENLDDSPVKEGTYVYSPSSNGWPLAQDWKCHRNVHSPELTSTSISESPLVLSGCDSTSTTHLGSTGNVNYEIGHHSFDCPEECPKVLPQSLNYSLINVAEQPATITDVQSVLVDVERKFSPQMADNGSWSHGKTTAIASTDTVVVVDSDGNADSDDEKLEKMFNHLRIQSARKEATARKVVSRKSLDAFIVSDSEELSDQEEDGKDKENTYPAGRKRTPIYAESPVSPLWWSSHKPFHLPHKRSLGTCITPVHSTEAPCSKTASKSQSFATINTPSAHKSVNRNRRSMSQELFELYNTTVFDNKLPADMEIAWNKRLRTTAGFCSYGGTVNKRTAKIELSTKVCDSYDRIKETLIHELCHAATWIVDGTRKAGHGRVWKAWANRAHLAHPDLTPITRCHAYEISYKYTYQCTVCDFKIGRHSRSINLLTARCPYCTSTLELC